MEMVDIHCHALFGIDDGAKDIEEARQMLDTAYKDGARAICFTPHFKLQTFKDKDSISEYLAKMEHSFSELKAYANEKYSDLYLCLGHEIMYNSEIFDAPDSVPFKSINGSSYLLVEFYPETSTYDMRNAVTRIIRNGYIPVIAHIERYSAFINKPNIAWDLREYGAILSVDASSVARMKIGKTARLLRYLFRKSYIDIVASNAHDTRSYKSALPNAFSKLAKLFGEDVAEKLLYINPKSIIENKKIFR